MFTHTHACTHTHILSPRTAPVGQSTMTDKMYMQPPRNVFQNNQNNSWQKRFLITYVWE